ncbi:MAG TPA: L,D-transpeptidase [Candidatus Sulfotelmatobacter sp.]|nr:L,D-transpeptidase [Candidatus Sulfotelmatobacter sp.]
MRDKNQNRLKHADESFVGSLKPVSAGYNVSASATAIPVNVHHKPAHSHSKPSSPNFKHRLADIIDKHSVVAFCLLVLAIALVARPLVDKYLLTTPVVPVLQTKSSDLTGLNTSIPSSQLANWLNAYDNQPATLNLGSQTVAINPNIIKSWVSINKSAKPGIDNIHLNQTLVASSLENLAQKYVTSPVNQVVATLSNGSSETAIAGRNGTKLANPYAVVAQASTITKNLFSNKGFQVSAPLVTLPFSNVTPASFGKLILVNVNSKVMYLYQNGQIFQTYLVTAGAPATPTPIGEFHIYAKYPIQNMSGYNPNGTPYFQPNVQYVNYFYEGDAVHGNYWRPASYFGNINSSHGCVGIPDNEAAVVYSWAPIGTTVITTPN